MPATGPFFASRFGFSVGFSELAFDFRDRKLNRGDLLGGAGEGAWLIAGESLRSNEGRSESGVASALLDEGDGEKAESTRGEPCLEEDRGEKPKRLRKLVEVADSLVSCDGVLL